MPFGGGKPPNYHLGVEVYHPNFCARQLGCPQPIPLKSYRSCKGATSLTDLDDLDVHKDCSSGEFDAWWKTCFAGLPNASTTVKTLFKTWDAGIVFVEPEAKKFIVQMVKGNNAQVIEDPSMTSNLGSQSVQAGEVVVTSIIAAGDLELPFGDEEDDYETLAEASVEITPSTQNNKRKEVTQAQDSVVQPNPLTESSPPPSKAKKLRKKAASELEKEEPTAVPAETTKTDEEMREAFEAVE
ncbi:hypothetical protein GBA52_010614 [Prunus armeniaca]|nr:hypothetical protein GBA52_010614 [Prunus armeniaca]